MHISNAPRRDCCGGSIGQNYWCLLSMCISGPASWGGARPTGDGHQACDARVHPLPSWLSRRNRCHMRMDARTYSSSRALRQRSSGDGATAFFSGQPAVTHPNRPGPLLIPQVPGPRHRTASRCTPASIRLLAPTAASAVPFSLAPAAPCCRLAHAGARPRLLRYVRHVRPPQGKCWTRVIASKARVHG